MFTFVSCPVLQCFQSAYAVKNDLCLFERPFKENKNGIFDSLLKIFPHSRDIQRKDKSQNQDYIGKY